MTIPRRIWNIGERPIVLIDAVLTETGAAITPTGRTVKYVKPDSTKGSVTPTAPGPTGRLRAELPTIDQAGTWYWHVTTSGNAIGGESGRFNVRQSPAA
ncbi:hypothetical protein BH24ACT15_BH24ACT15_31840 [soil metagenome]